MSPCASATERYPTDTHLYKFVYTVNSLQKCICTSNPLTKYVDPSNKDSTYYIYPDKLTQETANFYVMDGDAWKACGKGFDTVNIGGKEYIANCILNTSNSYANYSPNPNVKGGVYTVDEALKVVMGILKEGVTLLTTPPIIYFTVLGLVAGGIGVAKKLRRG